MGKKFDYKDPDNNPVPMASIASLEITIKGDDLCECSKKGKMTIEIEVDVHGNGSAWQNFNKVSRQLGEFIIDGTTVKFEQPPANAQNSEKSKAVHTVELPECPDKEHPEGAEKKNGEIKVVDLTRKGKRTPFNWTGVSQIYEYSWSYMCERTLKDGKCVDCKEAKKLDYDVKLKESKTVQPNL